MPYNNAINQNVSNRLNTIYLNHIRKEDQSNDNYYEPTNYDIVGQYEHAATLAENPDIVGGNAHEMTTLHDLGYEKTKNDVIKPRRSKKKPLDEGQGLNGGGMSAGGKPLEEGCGISAGGLSAGGMSAGAMEGCGMSGGDLKDVVKTVGDVASAVAPYAPLLLGLGSGKTRAEIVKEIMKEKNLSLIEASKYVKQHGLYKPSDRPRAKRKSKAKAKLVPKTEAPADETKTTPMPAVHGGAKMKRAETERAKIVRQIMQEKGLKLIEASKYVKEHGLYKPKEKGGSLLSLKSADAVVGDTLGPQTTVTGNVKPLKAKYSKEAGEAKPLPKKGGSKAKSKTK